MSRLISVIVLDSSCNRCFNCMRLVTLLSPLESPCCLAFVLHGRRNAIQALLSRPLFLWRLFKPVRVQLSELLFWRRWHHDVVFWAKDAVVTLVAIVSFILSVSLARDFYRHALQFNVLASYICSINIGVMMHWVLFWFFFTIYFDYLDNLTAALVLYNLMTEILLFFDFNLVSLM